MVIFGHPIAALAATVTNADLAGKNIGWRDGKTTFGKNGSFYSARFLGGAWTLKDDQLVVKGTHGGFTATIVKRNGTLHVVGYLTGHGATPTPYGTWGKYCK
jgi:hypothetical protein